MYMLVGYVTKNQRYPVTYPPGMVAGGCWKEQVQSLRHIRHRVLLYQAQQTGNNSTTHTGENLFLMSWRGMQEEYASPA